MNQAQSAAASSSKDIASDLSNGPKAFAPIADAPTTQDPVSAAALRRYPQILQVHLKFDTFLIWF